MQKKGISITLAALKDVAKDSALLKCLTTTDLNSARFIAMPGL